jgi:biopolymer transport protein ExbD
VYFGNNKIPPRYIPDVVGEAVKAGSERKLYFAADAHSKYGDVSAIVDQIRLSGVSQICFLTEKLRPVASQ